MSDVPWTHRSIAKKQSPSRLGTDDIITSPKTKRKCYVVSKEKSSGLGWLIRLRDVETSETHTVLVKSSHLFTVYA